MDFVIGLHSTALVDIYIFKGLIIVHSEPPAVLELPDPVAQHGLLVADAEGEVARELCGVLHQEQSVRPRAQ